MRCRLYRGRHLPTKRPVPRGWRGALRALSRRLVGRSRARPWPRRCWGDANVALLAVTPMFTRMAVVGATNSNLPRSRCGWLSSRLCRSGDGSRMTHTWAAPFCPSQRRRRAYSCAALRSADGESARQAAQSAQSPQQIREMPATADTNPRHPAPCFARSEDVLAAQRDPVTTSPESRRARSRPAPRPSPTGWYAAPGSGLTRPRPPRPTARTR